MSLESLRAMKCKMTLCFKALHEQSKIGLSFLFFFFFECIYFKTERFHQEESMYCPSEIKG